ATELPAPANTSPPLVVLSRLSSTSSVIRPVRNDASTAEAKNAAIFEPASPLPHRRAALEPVIRSRHSDESVTLRTEPVSIFESASALPTSTLTIPKLGCSVRAKGHDVAASY